MRVKIRRPHNDDDDDDGGRQTDDHADNNDGDGHSFIVYYVCVSVVRVRVHHVRRTTTCLLAHAVSQ